MSVLRQYQIEAVEGVRGHWIAGCRNVCLVAPTGAGKTCMGEELVDGTDPVLWVAHRRELINQTHRRLAARFGSSAVGRIMPGTYPSPRARIQVATVQTLLARELVPPAKVIALDEAHHYAAADWRALVDLYPNARVFGLTATPERGDGEPLGDIFGEMVIASTYSKLVADGYLVPARVLRPDKALGNDLAQDPVDAWLKHSEGSSTFMFCARVVDARAWAQRFRDAGVMADVIHAKTPRAEREDIMARFVRGHVRVIVNVNVMTEGVDVPEARTIILARAFGHVGGYLQAAGRGLRSAKDKPDMILLDLVGASIRHGLPTDDRAYSLDGRPISAPGPQHGCGASPVEWSQNVRGVDLQMVARGALPPEKTPEAVRPRSVDDADRRVEFERLKSVAKTNRMRAGFAAMKYHEKFGEWPLEDWK